MSTTKEDRSFKTLINRETTDSISKAFFNESGADTINVHADDIWSDTVPFDDPAQAVINGVAELRTLFIMTEDATVPSQQSYKAHVTPGDIGSARLLDWLSPKFGANFEVQLFENDDTPIFTTDAVDWFFDYQTGILTFSGNTSTKAKPFKITGYRYIGSKGVTVSGNVTVYVDTAGDDNAAGDIANPLLTIDEARKRVKLFGANKIIIGVGEFEVPNYVDDPNGEEFVLHGTYPGLEVEGTLVPFPALASVTVSSWTGNIANVDEVLTPGALKGSFMHIRTAGSSLQYRWVIDNDASTVTVAVSTANLGGFQVPETGVRTLNSIGTKIVSNSVSTSFPNRFFLTGAVTCKWLDFDGAVAGGSTLAWVRSALSQVTFTQCRFIDWTGQAVIGDGHMSWTTNWFENCPTAVSAGNYNNWSGDNVVIGASIVAILVGADCSSLNLGALDTKWIENCALFVSGRGGRTIQDFTPFAWIEGTLGTYVDFTGNMGNYLKGNLGMGFWPGQDAVSNYVKTVSGGSSIDFRDSGNGTMPTGNWVNDNGVVISLSDFNDGIGASTGVRLYAGPRGTFWFD